MDKYDVIIVGASIPGLCLANYLVNKNVRTTLIDSNNLKKIGSNVDQIMFTENAISFLKDRFNIRIPKKFIDHISEEIKIGTFNKQFFNIKNKFFFIKKRELAEYLLGKIIDKENFDFYEKANVKEIIYENKKIVGLKIHEKVKGIIRDIKARVIVDASGSSAIIRKKVNENRFFQRDIDAFDKLRVKKEIIASDEIKLKNPFVLLSPSELGRGYLFINKKDENEIYLEIGLTNSSNEKMTINSYKTMIFGEDDIVLKESDLEEIPIRRPFLSLVYKNVILLGTPACQNNPFITIDESFKIKSAFHAGKAITDALSVEIINTNVLWRYNQSFMNDIGNKIMILEAIRDFLTSLGDDDFEFVIKNRIVPQEFFNILSSEAIRTNLMQPKLLLKPNLFKKVFSLQRYINSIKSLISKYPDYEEFHIWRQTFMKKIEDVRKSFLI